MSIFYVLGWLSVCVYASSVAICVTWCPIKDRVSYVFAIIVTMRV